MREIDEARQILSRPFPREAIKQRRGGGGKMLDYVEGHTVIHRLNEATYNDWNIEIKKIERIDQPNGKTVMTAHVALTIPGMGTREHIGIQEVDANAGDLIKGCVTDAMKKAATLFGVGLELYGEDFEAQAAEAERFEGVRVQVNQRVIPDTVEERISALSIEADRLGERLREHAKSSYKITKMSHLTRDQLGELLAWAYQQ